ncbi:hypothetical protein SDC9_161276 [bioreactor metagenome]|uniref:Uncharacterized protein n=1 Tax=bioreactor metagenome TaxID=1076179 RepID=A0A645FJ09_9ZZZZ
MMVCPEYAVQLAVIPIFQVFRVIDDLADHFALGFGIAPQLCFYDHQVSLGADVEVINGTAVYGYFPSKKKQRGIHLVNIAGRQDARFLFQHALKPGFLKYTAAQGNS